MGTRTEGEQPALARRGDVEGLAVLTLAVGPLRADRHDRARREDHVAVLDLFQADPRGERRDGLEPQHLLDRARDQGRLGRQQRPLPGVGGEQPDRVRELARGGVDAASQQVRHQLDALRSGQPVTLVPRRQQLADQVAGRGGPPGLEQRGDVVLDLGDRPLDVPPAGLERPDVELPLHPAGPGVQSLGVLVRRPEHRRDRQRRVGPCHRGDEVASPVEGGLGP